MRRARLRQRVASRASARAGERRRRRVRRITCDHRDHARTTECCPSSGLRSRRGGRRGPAMVRRVDACRCARARCRASSATRLAKRPAACMRSSSPGAHERATARPSQRASSTPRAPREAARRRGEGGPHRCPLSRTLRTPHGGTIPMHAGPRVSASGSCVHSPADRPAQASATLPDNLDVEHATPTTRRVRHPACVGGREGEGSCMVAERDSPRRSRRGPIEAMARRRCGAAHYSSAHTRRSCAAAGCWRICPCARRSASMSHAVCTSGSPLALAAGLAVLGARAIGFGCVCGG